MTLTFGRYQGLPVDSDDVPDDYVAWLHDVATIHNPRLRDAIAREYARRFERLLLPSTPIRVIATELIATGYRALAKQHHPDRGGQTQTMQQINEAHDLLKHLAERLP